MQMNMQYEELPRMQMSLADVMPLIREQLATGQKVRFVPHGNSMWPMLRSGRDTVELSVLPQRLEKYDLVLYQRADGSYLLHRIIRVEAHGCTCVGDRQLRYEHGVQREQMIALVTAFCRDGHWRSIRHPVYRLYCRLWPACRFARRCQRKLQRLIRRLRMKKGNGE